MQKISYIHQMNGFLARMSEDALPANAVMLYLILFKSFNRTCWQQEWIKFTIQQLMAFTHVGSPNTVYNMRSLLKDLGYIDYRQVPGSRNQTEYRLLPLTAILPEATALYANTATTANTANTCCSAIERSINEYANTEHSAIEHSINEHSAIEHSVNEYSVSEHSATKCANTEYSNYEHSANEYSVNETSPQKSPEKRYFEPVSPSKNECSKTERSGDHSVDHSVELSKTEHSPIVKEEDKTISTTHVTTATDQAEGKNKTPKTVNEFCATNKDYLLCLDAYRDYFQKEPPSADKVKLIRFLAEYGTDSTLKALDIMMRNKADSLSYCEGVLRRMQWQMDKAAARRPAPRPHSDWQGWKMA